MPFFHEKNAIFYFRIIRICDIIHCKKCFYRFVLPFFRKNVELHCYSFVINVIDACHQSTGTQYRTRESNHFRSNRNALRWIFSSLLVLLYVNVSARICK